MFSLENWRIVFAVIFVNSFVLQISSRLQCKRVYFPAKKIAKGVRCQSLPRGADMDPLKWYLSDEAGKISVNKVAKLIEGNLLKVTEWYGFSSAGI